MDIKDMLKTVKEKFSDNTQIKMAEIKSQVEIPDDLWLKCPKCNATLIRDDIEKELNVCVKCGHHFRMSARERIYMISDADTFVEFDENLKSANPIEFPGYEEKIMKLTDVTRMNDAVITGKCEINGIKAVVAVMDSNFMMGSMGSVVGEKIARAFEYAEEKNLPVIVFTASGGARMQEGIVSLMQMAKTSAAVKKHSNKGLLYITVLTDPTTGGVTASFASLGDIIIAEPKALVGFAGRRVIEGTIKQKLPDEFQTAEFLLDHGFVDMIVARKALKKVITKLLKMHNCKEGVE